ncbi:hypothetical protein CN204_33200 [Sinorhizobium meliloti]|uniref:Uncharacterized protein n=2 Tax=Rhizobium meliloti TaxID=382 RepID=Q1WLD6_SINMM|nr:hypothetical protein [Sinorhizobium meliloti]ABA56064.1 hypothetical protein [Sinorhizobium meliloti]MDE3768719.1 hypothetical protein [Sinorhizobium meliloti]MDE3777610.1 hypothetical protein [Sinorhizobium meliloti]MDE3787848.1 hypothetical protein [Sinorhizobium meliloti]MDE3795655.1 hypothetical protein [Sinorhizobium meliloti]
MAAAIFLTATIPYEVPSPIRDSEHPSRFSFGISGPAAILVGNLVMHLCARLVNEHLDSMETKSRFDFGLSDPEGRPSCRWSCNHRASMAKVMITQIARDLISARGQVRRSPDAENITFVIAQAITLPIDGG